jgi:hypothetical protein
LELKNINLPLLFFATLIGLDYEEGKKMVSRVAERVCRGPWVFSVVFSEKCEDYFFSDGDDTFMRVVTCAWEKSAAAE